MVSRFTLMFLMALLAGCPNKTDSPKPEKTDSPKPEKTEPTEPTEPSAGWVVPTYDPGPSKPPFREEHNLPAPDQCDWPYVVDGSNKREYVESGPTKMDEINGCFQCPKPYLPRVRRKLPFDEGCKLNDGSYRGANCHTFILWGEAGHDSEETFMVWCKWPSEEQWCIQKAQEAGFDIRSGDQCPPIEGWKGYPKKRRKK